MKRIISPSLLAADFSRLNEQISKAENAGATRFHLDVMDGHFVPNITFGPFIVEAIRKLTNKHLETHLMITHPHKYLDDFINAGSNTVIIHFEASEDISRDILHIKNSGVKAGLAFNPDTPVEEIYPYIDDLDYILVMSVFPGFGGQKFIDSTLDYMNKLASRDKRKYLIGVDGGVNLKTINKIYETGIDVTIVGSGLYSTEDITKRFAELMSA